MLCRCGGRPRRQMKNFPQIKCNRKCYSRRKKEFSNLSPAGEKWIEISKGKETREQRENCLVSHGGNAQTSPLILRLVFSSFLLNDMFDFNLGTCTAKAGWLQAARHTVVHRHMVSYRDQNWTITAKLIVRCSRFISLSCFKLYIHFSCPSQ